MHTESATTRRVPARRTHAKGERTRERILIAALDLFSERGFTAVSVRDIATHAGLTHAGLLHHFAGKDDLLVQVLAFREMQDEAAAQQFSRYGPEQLFAWLVDIVQTNAAHPERVALFVRLSAEGIDSEHPANAYFTRRYDRIIDALARAFAAHFDMSPPRYSITAREAAMSTIALLDGLQVQFLLRPGSLDMTALVRTHLESLGIHVPDTLTPKDFP